MLTKHRIGKGAFTRVELIAITATVLLLSLLAMPSAANNRGKSKSVICLSNLRHLIFAWQLYAADHDGVLVGNYHGASAFHPHSSPWAVGWLDWTPSSDNTNINYLRERLYARLSDYILTDRNVHKCPADVYQSTIQRERGMHRVRSIAMNATIGDGNAQMGPWDPLYRQARTLADIRLPSPAETSVLLDEHPNSINDPLLFPPAQSRWDDVPGNLHSGAGTVSFADGHVELHAWKSPGLRTLPVQIFSWGPPAPSGDLDITFMSFSSQRSRDEVY